ncbi:MAG: metalloregulator ArsR/SmtB family transcription factor [Homoserinimonas sp.]
MDAPSKPFGAEVHGFLKALANPKRQEILFLFQGDTELTVGQVAERLGLAQSATSAHLSTLRETGILTSRREWKTVYYRVDPDRILHAMDGLRTYLLACCPPAGTRQSC